MVALLGSLEEHMHQAVECLLWQNQFSTLSPCRGAFLLGTWLFPCLWSRTRGEWGAPGQSSYLAPALDTECLDVCWCGCFEFEFLTQGPLPERKAASDCWEDNWLAPDPGT